MNLKIRKELDRVFLQLKNINKSFGSYKASDNVNFDIKEGKLIGLLGPSGSGKTTILRMIAGLENPDSGDIIINGERVNEIAPGKRGIGFVFQNYALFKHMTVFDNIAFGLKVQKKSNEYINAKVNEFINLIGLTGLENRYPHQLSGGQKQRVAFARALAPNPKLLLLDEPFAAIDAKVRKELRTWLKEMIQKLGVTSIFVTHDQDEAVEVADEIIITNKGRIEQIGTPIEIYKKPRTSFVTQFIGESIVVDDYRKFKGFEIDDKFNKSIIRPEFIEIVKNDKEILTPSAAEKGIITSISFRGNNYKIDVKVKDTNLFAYRSLEADELKIGEEVYVLIHRLYSFNDVQSRIYENKLKTDPMPVYI